MSLRESETETGTLQKIILLFMIATKQKANPVNGKVAVSPKGKTVRKSKKGKRYNVKPTAKQKKVIEILVENPRKTGGQVLKEA